MIELRDYFDPVSKKLKADRFREGTYGKKFVQNSFFDDGQSYQIALIGIPETRNAFGGSFDAGLNEIRAFFYELAEIPRIKVVDMGDLKPGTQVKDTYASVKEVVGTLLQQDIIPVILGGSQDITVPLLRAFDTGQNETELTLIDSRLDADDQENHSLSYVNQLIKEFDKKLILSLLAYQSYFVSPNSLRLAYDQNWNLARLGAVRNNFNQIEPLLRDSDMVSFDISSIRQSECPAASFSSPNGLYAEEACQLANLSGLSDKLQVFSLFEYQQHKDINAQSAHLMAQIIWHFIYGVSQRKNDFPKKKLNAYKKIYVKLEKMDADLVFYENPQNKRFWVEIPLGKNKNTKVISCSEFDYQQACKNEIPDRIWHNISRYLK